MNLILIVLKDRNLISRRQLGYTLSIGSWEDSCLSFSFWRLLASLGVLWLSHIILILASIFTWHSLCIVLKTSFVFLYLFALIAEEGFLISSCYSLELCIQMVISFLLCFSLLFFSQLFVRPPQTAILLLCISFHGNGLDPCLLYSVTNLHP